MTPSEALVETLVEEEVKVAFGIVGSAYMDALDLFPAAGIQRSFGEIMWRQIGIGAVAIPLAILRFVMKIWQQTKRRRLGSWSLF